MYCFNKKSFSRSFKHILLNKDNIMVISKVFLKKNYTKKQLKKKYKDFLFFNIEEKDFNTIEKIYLDKDSFISKIYYVKDHKFDMLYDYLNKILKNFINKNIFGINNNFSENLYLVYKKLHDKNNYCLTLDFKNAYYNVNIDLLIQILKNYYKIEECVLDYINFIYKEYFYDFTSKNVKPYLYIGINISKILFIFYINYIVTLLKKNMKIDFINYVDDFILFSKNKKDLFIKTKRFIDLFYNFQMVPNIKKIRFFDLNKECVIIFNDIYSLNKKNEVCDSTKRFIDFLKRNYLLKNKLIKVLPYIKEYLKEKNINFDIIKNENRKNIEYFNNNFTKNLINKQQTIHIMETYDYSKF